MVNRVPEIQKEYWKRRKLHKRSIERVGDWCILLGMNMAWRLGIRSWASDELNPDAHKVLPKMPESSIYMKESPESLAEKMLKYKVVSFDVFDTLILRTVERPADLFHIVGEKLGYLDFARLREAAEGKARQLKYQKEESWEVTLDEIWDVIEEDIGIPKDLGMQIEISTELEYCFGNPYFLEVFRYLEKKKTLLHEPQLYPIVICTSDMYLSSTVIKGMLKKSGYCSISEVFVSCERGASKSKGDIYIKIRAEFGVSNQRSNKIIIDTREKIEDYTFLHTGDNLVSDIRKAQEAGWDTIYYPNVNDLGELYRVRDLSIITGSLYRGIANAHIYNGLCRYSKEYELGFLYGGLFVVGYCQWIHRYVKTHGIDKVIFLSRDGDVLYKAYCEMYPQEAELNRTEYVYWSRLTATKLGAAYFKYDYFRRFLHHKVNQRYTLAQIFEDMELADMLENCLESINFQYVDSECQKFAGIEWRKVITQETILSSSNVEKIERYLKKKWIEVLEHYKDQRKAAGEYYRNVLQGHKKVAAVDIGWAGSGAIVLQYLAKQEWHVDCDIIGLLAGTNSMHNGIEKDTAEGLRAAGKQESYLYSQSHNREIWKFHNAGQGHNLLWELLLSSKEGSVKGFYLKFKNDSLPFSIKKEKKTGGEIGYEICLSKVDVNHAQTVTEIQRGILEFVNIWKKLVIQKGDVKRISGGDAYRVMKVWCEKENMKELINFFDKEGI